MSNAEAAFGVRLQIDQGGGSYVDITELRNLSGPELTNEVKEVTPHSTTNRRKQRITTLQDVGNITFDINYLPTDATHALLVAAWTDQLARSFKKIYSDAPHTTWTFTAFVTKFGTSDPVDGERAAHVELVPDGKTATIS